MQILNLSATINVASLEPSINTYRLGEGAGTYEYPELNNKPKINGVTLVGDISSANLGIKTSDLTNDSGYISEADIPTATSDLVNDSGFVNATQVQEVVSDAIPSDISYFNNDVGYITNADIGNIPTRTSQLVNDSGYITAAEAPVVSVNNMTGAVVLDGSNIEYEQNVSLNSKIDAVEADIPTATSELTNDSGFITNASIPTRTSQLVNDSGFVNAQNIPVQSVNGETGAVELTAADIDYDSENSIAEKIEENAQAVSKTEYRAGDTVDLSEVWCVGYQGNNTTRVFFIPLSKPLANGVNVSLQNIVVSAYSLSGAGETWNNANLSTLGTISIQKTTSGLRVSVVLRTAVSTTAYTPLAIRIISGSMVVS